MCALISNRMVEEFSFAYLEKLISHLKGLGAVVLLHICNNTTRLLNRMVEIGSDILSLDIQVDLADAKQIVAGRATISGNVATWNLAMSSPEEYTGSLVTVLKNVQKGDILPWDHHAKCHWKLLLKTLMQWYVQPGSLDRNLSGREKTHSGPNRLMRIRVMRF